MWGCSPCPPTPSPGSLFPRGCPSGRNPGAKVRLCRAQHSEPCRTSPWEPLGPGPSLRQPSPSWPTWRFTPMATLRPALSLRRTRPRSDSGQRPHGLHSPGPADLAGMAVTASVCVAGSLVALLHHFMSRSAFHIKSPNSSNSKPGEGHSPRMWRAPLWLALSAGTVRQRPRRFFTSIVGVGTPALT